jgi:hypothetical protein
MGSNLMRFISSQRMHGVSRYCACSADLTNSSGIGVLKALAMRSILNRFMPSKAGTAAHSSLKAPHEQTYFLRQL